MGSTPKLISGSRAAAILGLSPYKTRLEVFQELIEEVDPGWNTKQGYTLPPPADNASIRWGLCFENSVIKLAEKCRRLKITKREKEYHRGNLTAHIDGMYSDGMIHEGKTTSAFAFRDAWGEPGTDKIPRHYKIQVQHQMLLTGAAEAIVSVLVFPKMVDEWEKESIITIKNMKDKWILQDLKTMPISIEPYKWAEVLAEQGFFYQYHISADKAAQEAMLESYAKTWELVKARKLPEPEDMSDLARLFPEPKGTLIIPAAIEAKIKEYRDIKSEISDTGTMGKRAEQIKTELVNWIRTQKTTIDDESTEKLILRNETGEKCGQVSKTAKGNLSFL